MNHFSNPFPSSGYFQCEPISEITDGLHPQEMAIADSFKTAFRRAEFISGRRCAQNVLKQAGLPLLPVYRNPNRSPAWPFAVIGSITHGAGIAAAVVGKRPTTLVGIGLDIENLAREIKSNITPHILTPREIERWLSGRSELTREVRIIFSIKEAIYKCLFPINGISLGFHDAEIEEMDQTSFSARILKSPLPSPLTSALVLNGTIQIRDDVILAAVSVGSAEFRGQQ